jgi:type IV secretion system protein VirB9
MTRIIILSASALVLSACAGRTPPPAISYDAADFGPAAIEAEPPRPVDSPCRFRFPANSCRRLW